VLRRKLRLRMANWALRLVRRYFIGRTVVMETAKASVEGKITGGVVSDGELMLSWLPLGGTIQDTRRVSVFVLKTVNKEWVFHD
jgi:hypothetical protein